ncbi:MAG: extracellular solute-binding protein [Paenibacillus macerans]|uniref:Bacterial extracellular solute-binding family protein n=1 Tax=Paenibacillus macerans TaxID=44252 RepID=A0A090YQ35_PAEMA|nr:extracellular solute-binding protein [Paenibacillus macerans]KFM94235.1 bacterial extracellular solute-binding family protein [Paenibacillus macerans]MCY7558713.1 extracellular solute-binding protein [Paenibacillus macerans]MDU7473182.1 extracellular solute-binding protein [Paenibacillus macerans]MEC0139833.1 extracellular solute-binding protein [Paenibacillus macerans]MEC0150794.1 extracellular solute-binding protein [Paenibacillus macerans]
MKKKILALSFSLVLLMGLLSACGGGGNNAAGGGTNGAGAGNGGTTDDSKPVTINMFTASPEYTDAFNAYIAEYKKVKPNVTINLEIMQSDYNTVLKSRIAAGSTPDVFQTTAGGDIDTFAEYSADLTDQPLAAAMTDAVRANMTSSDGKVLGLPVKGNLFSLIYNKDLFEQAGITTFPKTTAELDDAIAKLEAKGIKPFANAYKEWWVWKHVFQHFVNAAAQDKGVTSKDLVNSFIAGDAKIKDYPVLYNNFFDFVDKTVKHGTDKPLERDSNAQISDFATGKAAIMVGKGAWDEEAIKKISPDIKIGIAGYPVSDKPEQATIITGADQALRINKDSAVVNETIEFFNWLYTSDYGKSWFSNVAKVIPPIKDAPLPELDMPKQMNEILQSEPSGDLAINYSLDTFHQKFGEIMQAYIGGSKTKDQAVTEIEQAWVQLGSAQ